MMSLQQATCGKHSSSVYVKMGNLTQGGMSLSDVNASTEARCMFSNAAMAIYLELQRGVDLDIRFVYYLCPEVWSVTCSSHVARFRRFLGCVVEESLGPAQPMAFVVRNFQGIGSSQARLRVWDRLLDHFVKPERHRTIRWNLTKAQGSTVGESVSTRKPRTLANRRYPS